MDKKKIDNTFKSIDVSDLTYFEVMAVARMLAAYAESMQNKDIIDKAVAASMFDQIKTQ